MVTSLQAIILGIVQGLAEFLPISSSAHLALTPWVLGWSDPGLAFDVALHIGTLVAVVWYFRNELVSLLRAATQIVHTRKVVTVEQRRVILLIIATIPAALAGPLLEDLAESTFRSPLIIGWALILLGLILWIVDRVASARRPITEMTWRDALFIGIAQVFALIPGVSRSGATMTGGRMLGIDRNSSAAFSFMMSIPIIGAAAVLKLPDIFANGGFTVQLIAGIIASAISGVFAITVLLRYVSKHSYGVFALYRVMLGALMLFLYYTRG
jgi:undecaprenyl-diphosphatase